MTSLPGSSASHEHWIRNQFGFIGITNKCASTATSVNCYWTFCFKWPIPNSYFPNGSSNSRYITRNDHDSSTHHVSTSNATCTTTKACSINCSWRNPKTDSQNHWHATGWTLQITGTTEYCINKCMSLKFCQQKHLKYADVNCEFCTVFDLYFQNALSQCHFMLKIFFCIN